MKLAPNSMVVLVDVRGPRAGRLTGVSRAARVHPIRLDTEWRMTELMQVLTGHQL